MQILISIMAVLTLIAIAATIMQLYAAQNSPDGKPNHALIALANYMFIFVGVVLTTIIVVAIYSKFIGERDIDYMTLPKEHYF